jgi:hypothetical protein
MSKWLTRMFNVRTSKSMIMWCKRQYHEAFEAYKMESRCFPADGASIACCIARVQTWEEILYYLTADKQWLE